MLSWSYPTKMNPTKSYQTPECSMCSGSDRTVVINHRLYIQQKILLVRTMYNLFPHTDTVTLIPWSPPLTTHNTHLRLVPKFYICNWWRRLFIWLATFFDEFVSLAILGALNPSIFWTLLCLFESTLIFRPLSPFHLFNPQTNFSYVVRVWAPIYSPP